MKKEHLKNTRDEKSSILKQYIKDEKKTIFQKNMGKKSDCSYDNIFV